MPESRLSKKMKQLVAARAKNRSEYCQCRSDCACESFEGEHIVPVSLGGTNDLENLAHACRGCNSRKADRVRAAETSSGYFVPLFHPRKYNWEAHFAWDSEYLVMIGLTPTGRATVEALQLNRLGVVNLRRLMKLGGIHPPEETTQE